MYSIWITVIVASLTISDVSYQQESACLFPSTLVSPCRCNFNQIQCSGSQVNDSVLSSVFANIESNVAGYLQQIDSFELINSNVKLITPAIFGKITVRNYIKMAGNRFTNFSIGNFDHLIMLDVSNNVFDEINSNTFVGLDQLEVLNGANICLKTLKKEHFSHLKNLKRLDLSGNRLERLPIDSFTSEYENNFQLNEIDISFNQLEKLPANIFMVMRQPREINLASNNLQNIDAIFNFSPDMIQSEPIKIILSNNSIQANYFANGTFDNLIKRQHYIDLDLTHNKIAWISEHVFGKLIKQDNKNIINFNDNPIQCTNCRNRWIIEGDTILLDSIIVGNCIEKTKKLSDHNLDDFKHCTQ